MVGIQKGEVQRFGGQPPHGRFSRPHETNKCEIVDVTYASHSIQLAYFCTSRTHILRLPAPAA
jgi:hypothetical protein